MDSRMKVCTVLALMVSLLFYGLAWADEADLVWSTFLGGSGLDQSLELAVDDSGNAYVIGATTSGDFPTTDGAYDSTFSGGTQYGDAFVAKLNQTGSALDYATYLGGISEDGGLDIAVDNSGKVYLTGSTASADFPTTAGAFDESPNGYYDVFVAKLNQTGSALEYATFIGGSASDLAYRMSVDGSGNAHVAGQTWSANFPTTAGAFDTTHNGSSDVFMAKLNSAGSDLDYATLLGGSDNDCGCGTAVDDAGCVYVTGYTGSGDFPTTVGAFDTTHNGSADVFVAKFDPGGSALEYATYLGGSAISWGYSIAVDDAGCAYVTGYTESGNFPATGGAYDPTHNGNEDVFVAKFNPAGSSLDYATFLGGSGGDYGWNIVLADIGNVYVTGCTESGDFPVTAEAFDTTYNGGLFDVLVAKLNLTSSNLDYSTFLGGSSDDRAYGIDLDGYGSAYVTGYAASSNFPTTAGVFDSTYNGAIDAFVAKLDLTGYPVPVVLASFEATGGKGFIGLDWVTASEVNCHRWEIYRGQEEAGRYAKIGELPGHGSTETPHTYRWVDRQVVAGTTYFYKLRQMDFDGNMSWSSVVSATAGAALPKAYALHQNYPNPFNTNTQIRYQIPKDTHVSLKVFNLLGQEVRRLVDVDRKASWYAIEWDGLDADGREVASGLYFCRLKAGDFEKTIKMMLVK